MTKIESNPYFNFLTLSDMLRSRSKLSTEGIIFVEGEDKEDFLSYQDLYQAALNSLCYLQSLGICPKSELVIQLDDNKHFIILFWACILGGIIPVPVTAGYSEETLNKLFNIWNALTNPYLVCTKNSSNKIFKFFSDEADDGNVLKINERTIDVNEVLLETKTTPTPYAINEEDLAFIQFSSGSTGNPNGVKLTHKNLLTNLKDISEGGEYTKSDKMLSWMPLTHDMGLIGFHLNPMYSGISHVIIPTALFVRRPYLWLKKVSDHNISVTCSPNFGYHYLLSNWKDSENMTLDLSCLRIIYNGAEPISVKLSNNFLSRFKSYGLQKGVIRPVYGLAEASLAVSMSNVGNDIEVVNLNRGYLGIGEEIKIEKNKEKSVAIVNVGHAIKQCNIRITDNNNVAFPSKVIGHVEIKGKNVTKGYYNNISKTNKVINSEGWLNTGDLGFLMNDELFITGRFKDVIFKNGQNFYSHDIERVAINSGKAELNKIAVSGYYNADSNNEETIAFIIHRKDLFDFVTILESLNNTMAAHFGFTFNHVIPVPRLPKTTSGKLQRFKLLNQFQNGFFDNVIEELEEVLNTTKKFSSNSIGSQSTDTEQKLLLIWQKVLDINEISQTDSFFSLGGNSLKLVQANMFINDEFNIELPLSCLYENQTFISQIKQIEASFEKEAFQIPKAGSKSKYPLSFAQKMLYYTWMVNKNSVAYNNANAFIIDSNVDTLKDSIQCLIEKNEIFKMRFNINEEPSFSIENSIDFAIESSSCTERELEHRIKSLIIPFDLSTIPLFRIHLIQVEKKYHVLFLDVHHIIFDGTSVFNFLEDLSKIHAGKGVNHTINKYVDYVEWEKEAFVSEKIQHQEKYWKDYLSESVSTLNLPTDFNRPSVFQQEGGKIEFNLNSELVAGLKAIAITNSCSIFVVLLTIYKVFLSKYAQQKNIVVGVPVSGRSHPVLQKMYGMFVNNIVLKSTINDDDTFIDFLQKQKVNVTQGIKNQDYPFYKLIEDLGKQRDVSRHPIFDTMFLYQNMGIPNLDSSQLSYQRLFFDPGFSKFDLSLEIFDYGETFSCAFEYNSSLFSRETIILLSTYFKNLTSQVISFENDKISKLRLMDKEELNLKVEVFNNTSVDFPQKLNIHNLFEQVVLKLPKAIAINYGDKAISYEELNRKADLLASRIFNECGSQESIIVLLERSPEFLISVLAILKSGNCFLPLEVETPKDRLEYIINDSKSKTLITNSFWLKEVNNLDDLKIIEIDQFQFSGNSNFKLLHKVKTHDVAYVIYTSGTSGNPKGVVVSHKSLVNYTTWAANYYLNETSNFSFPLFTSTAFDLSITSIFTPLINGNQIVIYKDNKNEISVTQVILDNKVNIIKLTPSHLKILDEDREILKNSRIKKIIVGGELLNVKLATNIYNSNEESIQIFNEYGPTEATVGCMIHEFNPQKNSYSAAVPIGKPINNSWIYVLDASLEPVPTGSVGEIYISGDCLSLGYLYNEELTSKFFIPNPFKENYLMYKSGDLAKYLKDGNIEYIGRVDNQVKINGYRIELSAIEECLRNFHLVDDVIVLIKKIKETDVLTAYYKLKPNFKGNHLKKIRSYLTMKLPRYMIPYHLIHIKEIPLTQNGKPDIKALPSPVMKLDKVESNLSYSFIEQSLIQAWEDILLVENISLTDNFFELGGDSIKAVILASKLSEKGILIEGKDILTLPTIELLNNMIVQLNGNQLSNKGYSEGEVIKTPILNWFFEKQHHNPSHYNQSIILELSLDVKKENIQKVFGEMIVHHDAFRLNYDQKSNTLSYNNNLSQDDFVINEIFIDNYRELDSVCESVNPTFDLENSVLLKGVLIHMNSTKKFLLIIAHHLAVDGISWQIILKDFYTGYKQIVQYSKIQFPNKSNSFKAWSQKLNEMALSESFENESEYWKKIELTEFELPKLKRNKKPRISETNYIEVVFDKEITADLQHHIHDKYRTDIPTLLTTTLITTLYEWKQFSESVVYLENHGRFVEEVDVHNTVGWFTNMYPVKFEYLENVSNLIINTKETLRKVPNKGIGYGLNKYYGNKNFNSNKIPEILFNYLGSIDEVTENDLFSLNSLKLRVDSDTSNFASAYWEWNMMINKNHLNLGMTYDNTAFSESEMDTVVQLFKKKLEDLIEHIKLEENTYLTISDFNTLDLDETELNSLFD